MFPDSGHHCTITKQPSAWCGWARPKIGWQVWHRPKKEHGTGLGSPLQWLVTSFTLCMRPKGRSYALQRLTDGVSGTPRFMPTRMLTSCVNLVKESNNSLLRSKGRRPPPAPVTQDCGEPTQRNILKRLGCIDT